MIACSTQVRQYNLSPPRKKAPLSVDKSAFLLAERVVRKLNVASPTLDNLELGEINPPKRTNNALINVKTRWFNQQMSTYNQTQFFANLCNIQKLRMHSYRHKILPQLAYSQKQVLYLCF